MSSVGGVTGMGNAVMPQVVSGASSRLPSTQKMANLFSQIDTSGSGNISRAQFTQAFQNLNPPSVIKAMGANAVFNKLDPNGTGSVSKQDFITGSKSLILPAFKAQFAAANTAPYNGSQSLTNSINSLNTLGNKAAQEPSGAVGSTINILA